VTVAIANSHWWEWCQDSIRWRGKVLNGKYAHWCFEWDGLPVDETTDEFTCCSCWEPGATVEQLADIEAHKDRLRAERDAAWERFKERIPPTHS
jgi:hypothetical protein